MATASILINRVLKGFQERGQADVLTAAMDSSTPSLSFQGFLPNWGPGTRVELGIETMLVTEIDEDTNTATVVRGWLSTTKSNHVQGSAIFVNPRFYRSDILALFNDCLVDLFGNDLYAVGSQEITYDSGIIGYPIDAEAVNIIRVDALKDDGAKYWETIGDWTQIDNANPSDFADSKAVMMRVALPPGAFRVIYSKPFTPLTSETEDLQTNVGLRPYMEDLPYYYAMSRMMIDSERHRSQMEAAESHQRAQDSPPFLALRTGEWYQARYKERILTAKAHLAREVKRGRPTGYGS